MTAAAPVLQDDTKQHTKPPKWWVPYTAQLQRQMLADRTLTPLARDVGRVLIAHLNWRTLEAYPRIRIIAQHLGYDTTTCNYRNSTRRQITRALKQLVAHGYWTETRRTRSDGGNSSTLYEPTLRPPTEAPTAVTREGSQSHQGVTPRPPREPVNSNLSNKQSSPPKPPRRRHHSEAAEGIEKDPGAQKPEATAPAVPTQANDESTAGPSNTLTARFVSRRFKIDRRDTPDMLHAWRARFGDQRTAEILRDVAYYKHGDRDALFAAFDAERRRQPTDVPAKAPQDDRQPTDPKWVRVRERLRREAGSTHWNSWLSQLDYTHRDNGTVTLEAPRRPVRDYVRSNYADRLRALWQAEDPNVTEIRLTVSAAGATTRAKPHANSSAALATIPTKESPQYA